MTKKYFLRSLLIVPIVALIMNTSTSTGQRDAKPGFDDVADRALQAMKKRAEELNIKGVAVVAVAPGATVQSWSSKMLVVGNLRTPKTDKGEGDNLLAIAYTKAGEMAETLKDSGSGIRPKLTGETGWQGGVTAKGKTGQLFCAFSGGVSADDVKVSQAGLAVLSEQL